MSWITSIIIGALVGWLAGKITNSRTSLLGNILLGWIGSILGNYLAGLLNITSGSMAGNIFLSLAGACLILFIFGQRKK